MWPATSNPSLIPKGTENVDRAGTTKTTWTGTLHNDTFNWIRKESPVVYHNNTVPKWHIKYPTRLDTSSFGEDGFVWKKSKNNERAMPYARRLIHSTDDVPFCVSQSDKLLAQAACRKRLLPKRPLPNTERIAELKEFVRRYIHKHYTPLPALNFEEITKTWIEENSNFNQAKKSSLLRALDKFLEQGHLHECDYVRKSFMKTEFTQEEKLPRYINGASALFSVRFGAITHLIEKQVYKRTSAFVKGHSPSEIPSMLNAISHSACFAEGDYTSFEGHFSPEYFDAVEVQLFRYMLSNNPDILKDFLRNYYQTKNRTVRGRRVKYIVPRTLRLVNKRYEIRVIGIRMSGDPWTSLFNGFSNCMNYMFYAWKGGFDIDLLVEGDDSSVTQPYNYFRKEMFAELGMVIKIEPKFAISDVVFCGCHYLHNEQKLLISPTSIVNTSYTCTREYITCSDTKALGLLRAKAMSLWCLGKNSPVVGPFAAKLLKLAGTGPVIVDGANKWWENFILKTYNGVSTFECTDQCRVFYANRFGITISQQYYLEDVIEKAKSLDQLYLGTFLMNKSMSNNIRFSNNARLQPGLELL